MTSQSSGQTLSKSGLLRLAFTVLTALAVSMYFFVPTALGQEETEKSFETSVSAAGHGEVCVTADGMAECEDVGEDASGQLAATVTVSGDRADQVAVDVRGCDNDRAGAKVVVSGLEPGAQVAGAFNGQATVDGETQEVDEEVGPISAGSGEATVSLCASADAQVDLGDTPGEGDLPGEGDVPGGGGLVELVTSVLGKVGLK